MRGIPAWMPKEEAEYEPQLFLPPGNNEAVLPSPGGKVSEKVRQKESLIKI